MPRMRGNVFGISCNEELRKALDANPNFVKLPNYPGRYVSSTRARALAAAVVTDASDPPYSPTASVERAEADAEGIASPAAAAAASPSPRRSMRLRPFYVNREVEPTTGNRRTRPTRELLLIELSSSDSQGLAQDSRRRRLTGRAGRSTRSSSDEFAEDNLPSTSSKKAARIEKSTSSSSSSSPESEANSASIFISVGTGTPRARRRKQNRPFRGPVV